MNKINDHLCLLANIKNAVIKKWLHSLLVFADKKKIDLVGTWSQPRYKQ